jgi:FKBP-type peptidyl-prolyl cis-trans isomerase FkpA
MKKITLYTIGLLSTATTALAQAPKSSASGFKKSASGIEYKIVKDVPGTVTAKIGDFITSNYVIKIGDSVMFDSRKMNNGNPIEMPLQENPNANKALDPTEVLMLLTAGDSVIIRTDLDTNARKSLVFPKATDKVEYRFSLVSIKSKEQFEADMKNKSANQAKTDDKTIQAFLAKNNIKAQKTASGLYYTIKQTGTGVNAASGNSVTVNYTGKTVDGTVFDSNIDPQFQHVQPFTFNLGQHQVIAGWDEGIALLNKGAKATLFIPSSMAYGEQSPSPKIPANSILIFDVELVGIN